MNETDDAILEFFAEFEVTEFRPWLAPTAVWLNLTRNLGVLDKSRDTVSRRMGELAAMGLLERVDEKRGYYRLTDHGVAYLEGELEADDLSPPEK